MVVKVQEREEGHSSLLTPLHPHSGREQYSLGHFVRLLHFAYSNQATLSVCK